MVDLINKIGSFEINPKHRINNLMLERFEEIRKEIVDIWVRNLLSLGYELSPGFVQSQNIQLPKAQKPVEQPSVNIKQPASTPPTTTVPVSESNFTTEDLPIDNVQNVEDTQVYINKDTYNKCADDVQDLDRAPSGEANGAQEIKNYKVTSPTNKGKETVADISFGLAIDTSVIAKGNLSQLSISFDKRYHKISLAEKVW